MTLVVMDGETRLSDGYGSYSTMVDRCVVASTRLTRGTRRRRILSLNSPTLNLTLLLPGRV